MVKAREAINAVLRMYDVHCRICELSDTAALSNKTRRRVRVNVITAIPK